MFLVLNSTQLEDLTVENDADGDAFFRHEAYDVRRPCWLASCMGRNRKNGVKLLLQSKRAETPIFKAPYDRTARAAFVAMALSAADRTRCGSAVDIFDTLLSIVSRRQYKKRFWGLTVLLEQVFM